MNDDYDLSHLLNLRKLTTVLAERFMGQAKEHLTNLGLLFQPRMLLGDLIRSQKFTVKGQDAALAELFKLYQPLARASALNLPAELNPPLDVYASTLELTPATYSYSVQDHDRTITMITPLKWVVTFKGNGPQRLRELIAAHPRSSGRELQSCVLHYLALYCLAKRKPGPAPILDALRFPLSLSTNAEFSGLPFVYMSSPVSTVRPSDELIFQSAAISGAATFEEVVDLAQIAQLGDPLQEAVTELVQAHPISDAPQT